MIHDNLPQLLADVVIIQGDTYEQNVFVEGVPAEVIEEVYFSCNKLNISKSLAFDSDIQGYVLLLSSQETKDLKVVTTDYDITVKLIGNNIKTGIYRGKLIVLEKNNTVEDL